jgi:hypothetical protein
MYILHGRKSSLSFRSDDFRLQIFIIFVQTYIAHASDDVFQNLKRRFSPNAFKEEHITQSQKLKGYGNRNAVRMLVLSRDEETGKLEKIVPGLTLGFKKFMFAYVSASS